MKKEVVYELEMEPVSATSAQEPVKPETKKQSDEQWGVQGETSGSNLLRSVVNFFTDGNVVVRVGIVVLFFGVAFLLKYAADRGVLSIEWRLMGAALGALAMIVVGWRLRHRRLTYALLIQGGGIMSQTGQAR